MNSLQRRLQLGLASSVVVLLVLLWWLLSGAFEKFGEQFVQSRLVHDVDGLLSALNSDASGHLKLTAGRMPSIYRQPFSGHYFVVKTPDKTLYSRSLWDETLKVPPLQPGTTRQWLLQGPAQQPLLVWAGGFEKQGQHVTLAVAEDLSGLRHSMQQFNTYFAVLSFVVLTVLLLVQQVIVRRSFRPLDEIRREIRNLQEGALGELTESVPAEVQPLVREVNHLLRLLAERLQRSRNAMGNLAHALKGPLSLLSQLAQRDEMRTLPELAQALQIHTDRVRQLMDRELKRARLMGQGTPGARFLPQEELPLLVDMLQRMYATDGHLSIHWQAPDKAFMFDRDDMLELMGNLLDNACKWARQEVLCVLKGDAQYLQLVVEDDGPGCSEEDIRRLTERGVRIDEVTPGHGLGLAIVRDVVEIYNGSLTFDRSPKLGGLRVQISLRNRGQ